MRKFSVIAIALLVCFMSVPAFAWEYSMSGAFIMEYRYATQLGQNGFFGPYDVLPGAAATATTPAYESPNFWHGNHFAGISGQDYVYSSCAATHATWMDIAPQIRINKAVRIRGTYRIGAHDQLSNAIGADDVDPVNYNTSNPGPLRSFAVGQWNMLWATAQTPWGIFATGKRPFAFGCGMFFDGHINTTTESVLFLAPYGPFRFLIGFFPARIAGVTTNLANHDGGIRDWHWAYAVTYGCGPLDIGSFGTYVNISGNNAGGVLPSYRDFPIYISTNYLKYANGRFFVNAEAGWHQAARKDNVTGRLSAAQTAALLPNPVYTENYRLMIEPGILAGPMRFSIIGALSTGGTWGDKDYSSSLGNTVVFKPYSLLMIRNYGGGTFYRGANYEGSLDNAYFLGARTDYAVAANLNVWTAFAAAWRWDRRTEAKGCVHLGGVGGAPNGTVTLAGPTNAQARQWVAANTHGDNRWIPNDDIGWEIYAGLDWKLMEGFRVQVDTAYFQPGEWWKHACVSSDNTGGGLTPMVNQAASAAADPFAYPAGINAERSIDPVLAFWISANFEY
jgi:hypothetical protein